MKKVFLFLLLVIPVLCNAQLPSSWYTTHIGYVLNPNLDDPPVIDNECLSRCEWNGTMLKIHTCKDNTYYFTKIGDFTVWYDGNGEKTYKFFLYEAGDGTTWHCIFYTESYSFSIMDLEQTLIVIYSNL